MAIPKSIAIAYPLIIAALFLVALPIQSAPPPPAPSPGVDCFPYLINMSDCLSFVESGSNLSKPEKGCCPELTRLMDTQPVCLCQLLSRPAQVGIPLDINRALQMPSACNVSTPPVSLCAGFGVPVANIAPSGGIGGPIGSPAADGSSVSTATAASENGTPTNQPSCLIGLLTPLLILFTYYFF